MTTSSKPPCGPFLPLLLFGVSLVIFLGWQVKNTRENGARIQTNIDQRVETARKAELVYKKFEQIAKDVIQLAPEDQAAQAVVAKYGIRLRSDVQTAAPAATDTP